MSDRDLSDLFARLKKEADPTSASPSPAAGQDRAFSFSAPYQPRSQSSSYQKPSVSSPIFSPAPGEHGPQPRRSDIMSLNTSANATPGPDRAQNANELLNLLKFNQPAQPSPTPPNTSQGVGRPVSTADFMPSQPTRPSASPSRVASSAQHDVSKPTTDTPQDMLLNLLKRNEQSSSPMGKSASPLHVQRARQTSQATPPPKRQVDSPFTPKPAQASGNPVSIESPQPQLKHGIFKFVSPFDDLAATSPRNRPEKTQSTNQGFHPNSSQAPWGRSNDNKETVAEAMNEAADVASKEATQALENANSAKGRDRHPSRDIPTQGQVREAVQDAAKELRDELEDGKGKAELEENVSKPVAEAIQETADMIAGDDVADSWEKVEELNGKAGHHDDKVRVYNFPMRPFVCIDVKSNASSPSHLRQDVVMKIASFKKEFDQIDRTLASASPNHIVYAIPKGGGYRMIRQDDGTFKTLFRDAGHQIFNVSISHVRENPGWREKYSDVETVLATGVDGSVYWNSISVPKDQEYDEETINQHAFIMPPLPSQDDSASTGQLKTRAKLSSRHNDIFAVGRGKHINVILPFEARHAFRDMKSQIVDTEKAFHDKGVKISTGKAGKDFAFSEDDTVIASLDKAGRLKFWDIVQLIDKLKTSSDKPELKGVENLKTPMLTHWVPSSQPKATPTSVLFVDKDRPTAKGLALRFMLVGLKQNHTVQLWDLGLGRAVQEINFPHKDDDDPICSIGYHAKSGIVAIGHPTRNSIYLINLSAPRYSLPPMTQSQYISKLATDHENMPRPDSTAILSGMRELSLAGVGQLRSLEVLSPTQLTNETGQDGETVFEVYVMHSRGVTCLNLKKQDLGWSNDGKVVNAYDAVAEGVISIENLQLPEGGGENGDREDVSSKASAKLSSKAEAPKVAETTVKTEPVPVSSPHTGKVNGESRAEKKKHKKKAAEQSSDEMVSRGQSVEPSRDTAQAASTAPPMSSKEMTLQPAETITTNAQQSVAPLKAPETAPVTSTAMDAGPSNLFVETINEQLSELYRRIAEDRRVQDAAAGARQDAVLRLVSSTLTDNVEKSLSSIIQAQMSESLLPQLSNLVAATLDQQLPNIVSQQLESTIPRELKSKMGQAFNTAFQDPSLHKILAESVSAKLLGQVEKHFTTVLQDSMIPNLKRTAADASRQALTGVESRIAEQLKGAEVQRQHDQAHVKTLVETTEKLSRTMQSMAQQQSGLERELSALHLKLDTAAESKDSPQPARTAQQPAAAVAASTSMAPTQTRQFEDRELEAMAELMRNYKLEDGTIRWIQSSQPGPYFDALFIHYDPTYLRHLNPIVVLSVVPTVSTTLSSNLSARLQWLEIILECVDTQVRLRPSRKALIDTLRKVSLEAVINNLRSNVRDADFPLPQNPDIAEYAPKLMEILSDRLRDEYLKVSQAEPRSRVLGRIHGLVVKAREIRAVGSGA